MSAVQVVWFKRDLRCHDHAPLAEAVARGALCALYVHEIEMIGAEDFSAQHSGFIRECLDDLHGDLACRGGTLLEFIGTAVDTFEQLWQSMPFDALWSHEESGTQETYDRDRAVADWCRLRNVTWHQIAQNGVVRGSKRRHVNPAQYLEDYTSAPLTPAPTAIQCATTGMKSDAAQAVPCGAGTDKPGRQAGGRKEALRLLEAFLHDRIHDYPRSISSPLTAEQGCSRLSPHLAHGTISLREVIHAMNDRVSMQKEEGGRADSLIGALKFYAGRLHWRTGYLQNLENRPLLYKENINSAMNGLRENEFNVRLFEAWKSGETGYPMVDAAMKMLHHTGWINMRLRGMLLSFAVNELWLHWRDPMLFLAREFLDYEPAIHWNQAQIHAGTAGGVGLLSYNPVKQARDHDAQGKFVRQWIPALRRVPDTYLFEPWTMPNDVQVTSGVKIGHDYPAPIVDHHLAGKVARDRVVQAQKGISHHKTIERSAEEQDRFRRLLLG